MTRAAAPGSSGMLVLLLLAAGCGGGDAKASRARADVADLPPARRDAEALGREVFELVDRAVDYRGSHRGRPAGSLRQLGIDSLTPTMVRRIVNLDREPVVTVAYRRAEGHEIVSCRGDGQILEEAAVSGGRFTLMCTAASGAQQPVQVGDVAEP